MTNLEYVWARDYRSAHVLYRRGHVLDLVLIGRAAYLFRDGAFKRFQSEGAALQWVSERAQ